MPQQSDHATVPELNANGVPSGLSKMDTVSNLDNGDDCTNASTRPVDAATDKLDSLQTK